MTKLWLVLVLVGCRDPAPDGPPPCTCAPALTEAAPKASLTIRALARRHQAAVRDGHRNGRDTKLVDDELRLQSAILCEPCGGWIGERATAEAIYPVDRVDDAVGVVCMGFRLRDGSVAFGSAHPPECRGP